jgi:hypothetical protein
MVDALRIEQDLHHALVLGRAETASYQRVSARCLSETVTPCDYGYFSLQITH